MLDPDMAGFLARRTIRRRIGNRRRRVLCGEPVSVEILIGRAVIIDLFLDHFGYFARTFEVEVCAPNSAALHIDELAINRSGKARVFFTRHQLIALWQGFLIDLDDMCAFAHAFEMEQAIGVGYGVSTRFHIKAHTGNTDTAFDRTRPAIRAITAFFGHTTNNRAALAQ